MRSWGSAGWIAVAAVLMVACSDDGDSAGIETTTSTSPTSVAPTTVPAPGVDVTVTGPVTGGARGMPYNPMPAGLAEQFGYVEEEFFLAGTASSYRPAGPLDADGRWDATPAAEAPYTTKILVRRPTDPTAFNGVVAVEWLNVSAGRDSDPDFGLLHPELLRDGYVWVGLSAQRVSIEGGPGRIEVPGVPAEALAPLKEWDPERYAPLDHPGDEYSYDIFSQVAKLLRQPGALVDPLAGLRPRHLLGLGESQSAGRLATYVNAVHPDVRAYDGYLIHSRGRSAAALNADESGAAPRVARIRTDLDAPVLQFATETDLLFLGFLAARQPDSDMVRTWEVAGTAHADESTLAYGAASGARWATGASFDAEQFCGMVNTGPQGPVLRAALAALRAWVVDGTPPPASPVIETTENDIVRDADGLARGGIRTPAVDAPTATLTGVGNPASIFCSLFGQTTPFTPAQLRARYATHDDYLRAVTASAEAARAAGFLLGPDADAMVAAARNAPVPSP